MGLLRRGVGSPAAFRGRGVLEQEADRARPQGPEDGVVGVEGGEDDDGGGWEGADAPVAASPSRRGMRMSISTTCGACSGPALEPVSPSDASPTSAISLAPTRAGRAGRLGRAGHRRRGGGGWWRGPARQPRPPEVGTRPPVRQCSSRPPASDGALGQPGQSRAGARELAVAASGGIAGCAPRAGSSPGRRVRILHDGVGRVLAGVGQGLLHDPVGVTAVVGRGVGGGSADRISGRPPRRLDELLRVGEGRQRRSGRSSRACRAARRAADAGPRGPGGRSSRTTRPPCGVLRVASGLNSRPPACIGSATCGGRARRASRGRVAPARWPGRARRARAVRPRRARPARAARSAALCVRARTCRWRRRRRAEG